MNSPNKRTNTSKTIFEITQMMIFQKKKNLKFGEIIVYTLNE